MSAREELSATVTPQHANPPYILALDIGTSSIRAILFDRLGRSIAGMSSRAHYTLHTAADGTVEADAQEMLNALWECIDTVTARMGALADQVIGVTSCSLVSNVLGVDQDGQAITPVYTYADTRPAPDVEVLRKRFDEREVHRRTGTLFHTSYLPARFLWLARTQPTLLKRVWRWMSIGEYMEFQLFGDAAVSYSVASWTGLLNRHLLQWDKELLEFLPINESHLSPLTDIQHPRRGLRSPYRQRWPMLAEIPWFPTIGDGAAANVGSGCVTPHRVALTMGTSSAIRVITAEQVQDVPWGLWCYRVDAQRSLPGGALSEGGNVFAWLREHLRLDGDERELEMKLASMPPDGHGLTILPFWAGERSPGWRGDARATVHGLTLAHTPEEILRAGMESVAYRLGRVFELLQPILPPQVEIIASGGALVRSSVWTQIIADVLGHPVSVSQVPEASARGTALLALEALGIISNIENVPAFTGKTFTPHGEHHKIYQAAMKRQQELYKRLWG